MFVVIDWIDGSGKWTQVKLLQENLEKIGKKVKVLDYPRYGEKSAFAVEKYLNGDYWKNVTAKQASVFYAIDRFDDSFNIRADLENYDYIISNRYVSASMIHQAGKISDKKEKFEFLDWLEELEYGIFWIPKPDKTIFLNVSPEMSQKLVLMKEERDYLKWWKKMDLHEEDKDHLTNAHSSAMSIVEKYSWVKIDCEKNWNMRSIDEINKEILNEIL
jgi:dTMP kinase